MRGQRLPPSTTEAGEKFSDTLVQVLAVQVEQATTDLRGKSQSMAMHLQVKADAEGSFANITSTTEADEKFIDLLVQDLAVQGGQATTDLGEKSESMAKRLQVQAEAEGSFADTISTKEADEQFTGMLVQEGLRDQVGLAEKAPHALDVKLGGRCLAGVEYFDLDGWKRGRRG